MNHSMQPKAVAWLRGGGDNPRLGGTVRFFSSPEGVIVEASIFGLPETETGFFAFHIHEGGSCAGEGFPNTGGHYNPDRAIHPKHAGDLPPLLSDRGRAYMKVYTDRLGVEEVIGKTVVIHSGPDDFRTQPAGNAGQKIACGVIRRNGTLQSRKRGL